MVVLHSIPRMYTLFTNGQVKSFHRSNNLIYIITKFSSDFKLNFGRDSLV